MSEQTHLPVMTFLLIVIASIIIGKLLAWVDVAVSKRIRRSREGVQ